MQDTEMVKRHYGDPSLPRGVDAALQQAGLGQGKLDWHTLTPMDQFHVGGVAATTELADALRIEPGGRLIDIGCGLGGPARFLAATWRCHVTGIDLTQSYIDVAIELTRRTGLADQVVFRQGDALDLPFADGSFDYAWTQHAAMNIADRAGLYASIRRVLKPDGRLAIHDIIAGDGRALTFPIPWARQAEASFLLSAGEMKAALRGAGVAESSWIDKTQAAMEWIAAMAARKSSGASPSSSAPALGLGLIMDETFPEMLRNLRQSLMDGRVRVVQTIQQSTGGGGA